MDDLSVDAGFLLQYLPMPMRQYISAERPIA
jgi:hypothetical protein